MGYNHGVLVRWDEELEGLVMINVFYGKHSRVQQRVMLMDRALSMQTSTKCLFLRLSTRARASQALPLNFVSSV